MEFENALQARTLRAGINLGDAQSAQLARYYSLLCRWNRKINLTALPIESLDEAAIDRLFVEPIAAAANADEGDIRWVDLGSGGGSPAIPMKIMRPHAALTMVEARSRKVAFLREVARDLALPHLVVLDERIEALPAHEGLLGAVDLVTIRAVRPDRDLFEVCRLLLRGGGRLMLFHSGAAVANTHGPKALSLKLDRSVCLIPSSESYLSIFRSL